MTAAQVLTAAQMRAAEQALFDAGTSVSDLMEIAAGGAAEWIRRIAAGRSVTVLCGPGNNGGDGLVVARRLCEQGWPVTVALWAPMADFKGDALHHARLWLQAQATAPTAAPMRKHGGAMSAIEWSMLLGLSRVHTCIAKSSCKFMQVLMERFLLCRLQTPLSK